MGRLNNKVAVLLFDDVDDLSFYAYFEHFLVHCDDFEKRVESRVLDDFLNFGELAFGPILGLIVLSFDLPRIVDFDQNGL